MGNALRVESLEFQSKSLGGTGLRHQEQQQRVEVVVQVHGFADRLPRLTVQAWWAGGSAQVAIPVPTEGLADAIAAMRKIDN